MAKGKAASLADVQNSLGGDSVFVDQQQQLRDFEVATLAVNDAPEVAQRIYKVYKLVDTKRRGRLHIHGQDFVINPKTNRPDQIWLITGASTIWASEMPDMIKDRDYVSRNRRSLTFEQGILRIPTHDILAIEFIENCTHFIDNPSRRTGSKTEFFEYDPEKQARASLEKEMLELDMIFKIKEMDEVQVKKLAGFLGISFYADYGFPKPIEGIKRDLMMLAKRNPSLIEKNLDNKQVDIAYLISKCITENKIDVALGNGNVGWANGRVICKIPASRKPVEYLLELAMTNSDEGRSFLQEVERQTKL